ncbi:hypothetical protein ACES2I_08710 [Bdellovibrio bacteriovorus]|uniref:hypothetical protein n=1 Tax=Bdellovibrio bacteriovorus TaxID=959 RepID=UPI0035A6DCC1
MITCELCKNSVATLKENSHIVPRWMLSTIKQNGRLITVESNKGIKYGVQKDLTSDIVCSNCEKRFALEDGFAADFFRNLKYAEKSKIFSDSGAVVKIEYHSGIAESQLLCFLLGVVLRMDLYQKKIGDASLLGGAFDRITEKYQKGKILKTEIPYLASKHPSLDETIIFPERTRLDRRNAITCMFFGYRFIIVTDRLGMTNWPEIQAWMAEPNLPILITDESEDSLFKGIAHFAKGLPELNRRK